MTDPARVMIELGPKRKRFVASAFDWPGWDRGARTDDDRRLPAEMRRARELAGTNEGDSGTEGLRKAILQYQTIVDAAVGESMRKSLDSQRQEVAS